VQRIDDRAGQKERGELEKFAGIQGSALGDGFPLRKNAATKKLRANLMKTLR
jgi:hypothetical protein